MVFSRRAHKQNIPPLSLADAKRKLMDLVARRDHTEKELRSKLSLRADKETVDKALSWAKEQNWLVSPEKLKTQLAEQLGRRGHGIHKINRKLKNLGLDTVKAVADSELEKAKRLVTAKWKASAFAGLDFKESQKLKAKIMRFLMARGFESAIISSILKTEFKNSQTEDDFYDEER